MENNEGQYMHLHKQTHYCVKVTTVNILVVVHTRGLFFPGSQQRVFRVDPLCYETLQQALSAGL